ncbi:hypothetical protein CDAR_566871 [Caerostris darwini]|uniref:Uncharacterized protein n=1 Tax=Caerostris darwini TaxID=1538125 RepID=A0AAV4VZ75_9ARAC|nr:hypothetical protein CDAR_566871 [Caerostris darwini]
MLYLYAGFYHSSEVCYLKPRCSHCETDHKTANCTLSIEPRKGTNYHWSHVAYWCGCPIFPRRAPKTQPTLKQRTLTEHSLVIIPQIPTPQSASSTANSTDRPTNTSIAPSKVKSTEGMRRINSTRFDLMSQTLSLRHQYGVKGLCF